MNAIFKGNTQACIAHLRDAIQDDYLTKRHVVATFAGVGDDSVRRWFVDGSMPVGEALVRLRFYLEFLGYQVEEVQKLSQVIRDAARIYAFGVVSLSEVASACGFTEGRNGPDLVLRVFRGGCGISKHKQEQFTALAELYSDELAERKRATQKVLVGSVGQPEKVREDDKPTPLPVRLASQQPLGTHEALIESLAGLVEAMIPLAREISSDRFTPEERARVRELAGRDGVFTLANLLYRMCGERSRSMHS